MKTTRIFQEISRLDRRDFSKDDADDFVKRSSETGQAKRLGLAKKQKPLPGGSGLGYVFKTSGYTASVHIFDKTEAVGLLTLSTPPIDLLHVFGNKTLAIETIGVEGGYEGRRIGLALYGIPMKEYGYTLLAGDSQTPDGRRMWTKLNSIPGVEVGGYNRIRLDRYSTEKDVARVETMLQRLSEQYGVEIAQINERMYVVVFPVGVDPNGREMASMITPFKVYGHASSGLFDETGMYARWVG
jgi:hypothetical protein